MYSSMSDPQVARSVARMRTDDQVRFANARRTARDARSQGPGVGPIRTTAPPELADMAAPRQASRLRTATRLETTVIGQAQQSPVQDTFRLLVDEPPI